MFSLTNTTLITCDMQWCVPSDPITTPIIGTTRIISEIIIIRLIFEVISIAINLHCRIIMVDVTAVFDEFVHHHHVVIGHSNTLKKMFEKMFEKIF